MKKVKTWALVLMLLAAGVGVLVGCRSNEGADTSANESIKRQARQNDGAKGAILVISFGTSYNDTRALTIDAIEAKIAASFPDYELRRAFTSQTIIDKLAERDGLVVDNVAQAMARLIDDGYDRVICQPTHVMNGYEYDEMVKDIMAYADSFSDIRIGKPLLTSTKDYFTVAEIVMNEGPKLNAQEALVLMGHGTEHFANATYSALDYVFADRYEQNVFVGTVEGFPEVDSVLKRVKAAQVDKVYLMPLMIVAGDHATNDMAGDEEGSWKMVFKGEGYEVETILRGLGEFSGIQQLFIDHIQDAIANES